MSFWYSSLSGPRAGTWRIALALPVICCGLLGSPSPARAQCVTSGNDQTCTNSGTFPGDLDANATNGNATATNSGNVAGSVASFANITGNATATNSGSVGGNVESFTFGNGNATATNSGTVGSNLIATISSGNGNATVTNSGTVGGSINVGITFGNGNATALNSGSVGSGLSAAINNGNGNATVTNSGNAGAGLFANVNNGNGNATITNSGSATGNLSAVIDGNGNATVTNSGVITGGAHTFIIGNGNATVANSGTVGSGLFAQVLNGNGDATIANSGNVKGDVAANASNGNATVTNAGTIVTGGTVTAAIFPGNGNALIVNSGSITATTVQAQNFNGNGNATLINAGTIVANVVISTSAGPSTATLTNYVGSSIVGRITLQGSPFANVNFIGGNFLYTLNSLSGVTINASGAPFAVSGNTVAVLDTSAFAYQDRSVMQFTAGVSSMLQDRFGGMGIPGGATDGGALGFAPTAANRVATEFGAIAQDAFTSLPSVAMSYSSTGANSAANNAYAMFTKAPPPGVSVYDTVVWTSGFAGERVQLANGSVLGARDTGYGGAIGFDRQLTSDLRLGAFVGAGSSRMQVDLDLQKIDSDYAFAGGYGRFDRTNAYVDFALFGGRLSNKSERHISNNLAANGFDLATASYGGWFISPDVTYGYRIFLPEQFVVTPKARVRYVGGSLDAYTENGSAQGLSIGKRSLSDLEERLGVEVARVAPAPIGGGTLKASVDLSGVGLQRLGDTTINGVLLTQNISFTTPGKSEAYGGALNVGIDWRPQSNISIYASAEGTAMNDRSRSATGKGGVRIGF